MTPSLLAQIYFFGLVGFLFLATVALIYLAIKIAEYETDR